MDDLVRDFLSEATGSIGQVDTRSERLLSLVPAAIAGLNGRPAERAFPAADEAAVSDWSETLEVPMDAVLHDQAELLDETLKMMTAWTKRRHEAMEAGLQALRQFSNTPDVGEIAAAYSEWLTSSMSRIIADMAVARDGTLRLIGLGSVRTMGSRATAIKAPVPGRGAQLGRPLAKPRS